MATAPPNSPSPYAPRPAVPTRGMLASWGLIPASVFAAVHCLLGWKNAQVHAEGPQFVLGYWVGGLVGGFLIASVVAWIMYRSLGKSQTAGTVAFTIILAIGTLSIISRSITAAFGKRAAPAASDKPVTTSYGEFEFEIPAGWTSVRPEHEDQKAYLLLNSNDWRNADGRIDVDLGTPALPTARQLAKSVAGKNGKIQRQPIFLDGVEGVRVDMPSPNVEQPSFCAIVFRGGQAYLIFAAQAPGHDVSQAFEHVVKTWRWTPAKK